MKAGGVADGAAVGVGGRLSINSPLPGRPSATSTGGMAEGGGADVASAGSAKCPSVAAGGVVTCGVGVEMIGVSGGVGDGPVEVCVAAGAGHGIWAAANATGWRVGHRVGAPAVTAGVAVGALNTTWPGGT